eukprot:SAG22_NODE_2002_length_3168_cov_2.188009_2_plen_343_part_00
MDSLADNTASFGFVQTIESGFPCRSVIIQGGYHSTTPEVAPSKDLPAGGNGTLVLIGSVEGAIIQSNDCGAGEECHNFAVVTTGSEAGVWAANDVVLAKNTGWDYTGGSVRLIDESLDNTDAACGGGLAAAGKGAAAWSCEQAIGYTFTDTPALCGGSRKQPACHWPSPKNFVMAEMIDDMHMQKFPAVAGYLKPQVTQAGIFNQRPVYRIAAAVVDGAVPVCAVVATLPLATTPSAAGKTVHFTVMARAVAGTGASVSLMIDRGTVAAATNTTWLTSSGGRGGGKNGHNGTEWGIRSFQTRLAWSGVARFAIVAAAADGSGQPPLQIEVGWVRVAQVGTPE